MDSLDKNLYQTDEKGDIIFNKDGTPRKRGGRPAKAVDVAVKKVSRSPEQIREDAKKRREEAQSYKSDVGALNGQRLVVKQKEGFYRYFVNDDGRRIDSFLQMGYYFVQENQSGEYTPTEDLGSRVFVRVGTKAGGGVLNAYLMEIPEELYRETQNIKEQELLGLENQIRRGEGGGQGRLEQAYNPNPHGNNINEV